MGDMLFDPAIFDPAIFDTVTSRLRRILWEMEKKTIGEYCFEAGCVEPGVDNAGVPLRRILSNMEG